jgi:ATP-dependent Clp protease ATP-binding subunit ClpA
MEISPGVELTWSLAGREALAAQLPAVEPEHFFCALLKFSEMDADDLTAVAARPAVAKILLAERDQVQAILKEHSWDSTAIRRQLRRKLGQGNNQPTEEGLHRSDTARQIFELAARRARQENLPLDAPHLLQTLLDNPTPAMQQVLGLGDGKALPNPARPESPWLARFTQDLAQLADGGKFDPPAVCAPQVQVLSLALNSADSAPILLIWAPGVPGLPIVGSAAQAAHLRVAQVDHHALLKDDPNEFLDRMAQLLSDASTTEKLALFFDATGQKADEMVFLLTALKPGLNKGNPRLILAVSTTGYPTAIDADPDLEGVFRTIWLHELTEAGIPALL